MRRMLSFFILLLLSVWVGLKIHNGNGSLFIVLQNWTLEMPSWLAAIAVLSGYFVLFIVLKILSKIFNLKQSLKHFKEKMQMRHSRFNTQRGLIEFSEGNWKEAERHLVKTMPESDASLLNYLTAARAAQELGAPERRDEYLREAQKALPDAKMAIELTQAQLQIANEQWEQALATLNHLHILSPYHPYVIKLLVKVYLTLKDWSNLEKWLPDIRRKKLMSETDFLLLENEVYTGLLEEAAKAYDIHHLKQVWEAFPKLARRNTTLVIVYVTALLKQQAYEEADLQCRENLKHAWNDTLIILYGECLSPSIEEQLRFAENLLKSQPENSYLLSALGKICMRRQLWGKAKSYFLKSIQIKPEAKTYAALATLFEELDDKTSANEYYKKCIQEAFQ